MALFKKKKQPVETKPFDQSEEIKKLNLFITIVPAGQAGPVTKIFSDHGVSAQFVQRGRGTATKQILDILGIEENGKDVVLSFIKKDSIPDAKIELEAFFAASKRNKGIGFSIPMTSLIGVKVYQFLADTL